MPRRAANPAENGGNGEYIKLENRLVLLAWLNNLFGFKSNRELLANIKDAGEGFDSYGRSYVHETLVGRGDKVRIPAEVLGRYDDNIRAHLNAINARRPEPIKLRYFQYLSVLYAEIFMDWYFSRPGELLAELNALVQRRNADRVPGEAWESLFAEEDLTKLAFWMATGSGKTLVMHFNYLQFLFYNKKPLDNILLITPNEGLTDQHIEEMGASGIPCARFNIEESGLWSGGKNVVRVIEITKLVEEKRGGGVSVDVECFQGNNLIFVDEGHKGSGGEAWRKFRDRLGETGFTFEYSATFGQALTAARNDELTAEYGKAIAFDYSYKYFHGNGFGKDFHILNLREETREEETETLLLGNLLSFYEQQRCYTEQADALRPYNLEMPLWVFVGSSVNAVYKESGRARSDVLTVARFLHHFLENKRGWSVRTIKKLIEGESGLRNQEGGDVFAERFEYLRGAGQSPDAIYHDILSTVFHAPAGSGLHMCDIKGWAGELGLRAGAAENYFGLIYIGDTASFKKLVEEDNAKITLEDDAISASLFAGINRPEATITVLIGAKKFMEGWNSWRVSNMGLLNIGLTEGSEIIQLFGRGVRLRGLGFGLKRSTALGGTHPEHIRLLETLNIFAVRANYMVRFREYLEREGVETLGQVELPLPIRASKEFLGRDLIVPRVPPERDFAQEYDIVLAPDPAAKVFVDMSLKVESMRSGATGLKSETMHAGREVTIPAGSLDLVDWSRIYLNLIEYKEQKGFANLVIRPQALREILVADGLYRLVADEAVAAPKSFAGTVLLTEAVLTILSKYVEKFYYVSKEHWDSRNMVYVTLDGTDPNFRDYTIRIDRTERELIEAVQKLIAEGDRVYCQQIRELPNIHFDRHLYQPLLVEHGEKVKSEPPGLNESERRFVESLREFVHCEASKALAGKEVFLLRNLSRGKGVGFFNNEGFYPDFILWIKEGRRQRVVFVEPHGMLREKTYWNDDKAQLYLRLQKLSKAWGTRTGRKNVMLDSFIVSATPYDVLRHHYATGGWSRERFAEAHILFFEDVGYVGRLFEEEEA